jgi:hypothetical protein
MEKSAHRHTWIASITRILHYCEAAGLFDSNEPSCGGPPARVALLQETSQPQIFSNWRREANFNSDRNLREKQDQTINRSELATNSPGPEECQHRLTAPTLDAGQHPPMQR